MDTIEKLKLKNYKQNNMLLMRIILDEIFFEILELDKSNTIELIKISEIS